MNPNLDQERRESESKISQENQGFLMISSKSNSCSDTAKNPANRPTTTTTTMAIAEKNIPIQNKSDLNSGNSTSKGVKMDEKYLNAIAIYTGKTAAIKVPPPPKIKPANIDAVRAIYNVPAPPKRPPPPSPPGQLQSKNPPALDDRVLQSNPPPNNLVAKDTIASTTAQTNNSTQESENSKSSKLPPINRLTLPPLNPIKDVGNINQKTVSSPENQSVSSKQDAVRVALENAKKARSIPPLPISKPNVDNIDQIIVLTENQPAPSKQDENQDDIRISLDSSKKIRKIPLDRLPPLPLERPKLESIKPIQQSQPVEESTRDNSTSENGPELPMKSHVEIIMQNPQNIPVEQNEIDQNLIDNNQQETEQLIEQEQKVSKIGPEDMDEVPVEHPSSSWRRSRKWIIGGAAGTILIAVIIALVLFFTRFKVDNLTNAFSATTPSSGIQIDLETSQTTSSSSSNSFVSSKSLVKSTASSSSLNTHSSSLSQNTASVTFTSPINVISTSSLTSSFSAPSSIMTTIMTTTTLSSTNNQLVSVAYPTGNYAAGSFIIEPFVYLLQDNGGYPLSSVQVNLTALANSCNLDNSSIILSHSSGFTNSSGYISFANFSYTLAGPVYFLAKSRILLVVKC